MLKTAKFLYVVVMGALIVVAVACPPTWAADRKERARSEAPYSNRSVQRERFIRETARKVERDRQSNKREYDFQRRARDRDRDEDDDE